MDVTIDLGEVKPINTINARFLKAANFNTFPPKNIVSNDGKTFESVAFHEHNLTPSTDVYADIQSFVTELDSKKGRYVRVKAKSIGSCPEWHSKWFGANMCSDEILIK